MIVIRNVMLYRYYQLQSFFKKIIIRVVLLIGNQLCLLINVYSRNYTDNNIHDNKTSFCCSARSSGDLSGLIKTLPKSSELRRCLSLVKICCTIVELVKVTLKGLSATCFLSLGLFKPILLASIFSAFHQVPTTLDRPCHITAHLSLL